MPPMKEELMFLVLQYLDEENYPETLHKFEQECGLRFNMKYIEEKILAGDFDEVERYISAFTKLDGNIHPTNTSLQIRKQKYLEALNRNDMAKAAEILNKELKVFATWNAEYYKGLTKLLTVDKFREKLQFHTIPERFALAARLKELIEANPVFLGKLEFPVLEQSRLRVLINQSLNWQHSMCKHPKEEPDDFTLYTDHTCDAAPAATCVPLPFPLAATAPCANVLPVRMPLPTAVVDTLQASVLVNQVSMLKRPRTPANAFNNQSTEHGHVMKRLRSSGQPITDEAADPIEREPQWCMDDLPRTLVWTFHMESCVTSLDFHPSRHTLILAGSMEGEIGLWEIGSHERLVSKSFKIWNLEVCSAPCKASFHKDPTVSITRVTWSPAGNFVGVAHTKHLIHLYGFQRNDLHQRLEIDAHIGRVNDLAFANVEEQLYVVSCGDDKQIKVWNITGQKMYAFEGHDAPVYSVYPHHIKDIPFVLSTAADGKIKTWLYDNLGSRSNSNAPGKYCTKMMYSADGTRLFSCGTRKDEIPFLVEWNETEGGLKRMYSGFTTKAAGVVQFDMAQNLFLAAGEDHQVKFWHMDDSNPLCSIDNDDVLPVDGILPSRPCLRFNKEGNLLAVSTVHSGFKILANAEGMRSLKELGSCVSRVKRTEFCCVL